MKIISAIKRRIKSRLIGWEANRVTSTEKRSYDKVFVIGFNKTGTTTLYFTLKGLGFNMGEQRVAEVMSYFMFKNNDFSELKAYCQTGEAFQDIPFSAPGVYTKLFALHPNAKFILTIRDSAEQWYNSLVNFQKQKHQKQGEELPTEADYLKSTYVFPGYMIPKFKCIFNYPDVPLFDKQVYQQVYEKHTADVTNFFKDKKEQLLILNVSKKGERHRLLAFLEVKPSRFLSDSFSRFKKTTVS